jgi:hypothetical protein
LTEEENGESKEKPRRANCLRQIAFLPIPFSSHAKGFSLCIIERIGDIEVNWGRKRWLFWGF